MRIERQNKNLMPRSRLSELPAAALLRESLLKQSFMSLSVCAQRISHYWMERIHAIGRTHVNHERQRMRA